MLNNRRQDFRKMFDEGQQSILGRSEQERGNLQKSDANNQRLMGNTMRAAGVTGGSAALNYQGQRAQDNARAASMLNEQRDQNDQANQRELNTRDEWARGQEGALNRFLGDAGNARQNAEAYGYDRYVGNDNQIQADMRSYFDQIQARQDALAASNSGIAGYQAPQFTNNIGSFLNALNAPGIKTDSSQGAPTNAFANINNNRTLMDELYRKQAGMYA
jgi:hypothetical protein